MIIQLSLQLTLPTITSDYLVPCGETHLTNSSAKSFIPTPPPPIPPFSKCHVTFPYFYFHFKETACSSNFKEAQIPVDFSVQTKQVLTGVEHKLREKREMAALAFPSHLPYCTCQAIAFLLVMYHLWIYWYPKLCVSSTLFYVFYTPRKSDINKIGLMAYFLVHWLMLIFS